MVANLAPMVNWPVSLSFLYQAPSDTTAEGQRHPIPGSYPDELPYVMGLVRQSYERQMGDDGTQE